MFLLALLALVSLREVQSAYGSFNVTSSTSLVYDHWWDLVFIGHSHTIHNPKNTLYAMLGTANEPPQELRYNFAQRRQHGHNITLQLPEGKR